MEDLVNVCLEPFVTSVECLSVARDGYTAANLIAVDPTAHGRGFRVEHFIRPPVSILIEFKWPVRVATIFIRPALETDSEVKVCFDGCHISNIDSYQYNLHSGVVARGNHALLQLANRSFDRKWEKKIDFSSDVVAMVKGSQVQASEIKDTLVSEQPLRHINIASRLKQLRLTVTRLTGVKPLVINWIEIWGTPSDSCSALEVNDFRAAVQSLRLNVHSCKPKINLYSNHNPHHPDQDSSVGVKRVATYTMKSVVAPLSDCKRTLPEQSELSLRRQENLFPDLDCPRTKRQRMKERLTDMDSATLSSRTNEHTSQPIASMNMSNQNNPDSINMTQIHGNDSSDFNSFLDAPVKFLDAITYEVMLIPMTLPSGHFVDRSTVNKLASNDAQYGRLPTDPFTGVIFTEHSKPQFCPERKVEIDEFLTVRDDMKNRGVVLEDAQSVTSRSRTVGAASDISKHLTREAEAVISSSPNERAHPVLKVMASSNECSFLGGPQLQSSSSDQRGYEDNSAQIMERRKHDTGIITKTRGVNEGSFEDKISGSLDAALEKLFHN